MDVIAIYKDRNYISSSSLDNALKLPGNPFVFTLGSTTELNSEKGVQYYGSSKEQLPLRIGELELIEITKYSQPREVRFSIFDHRQSCVQVLKSGSTYIPAALSDLIEQLIYAAQFPTWESFNAAVEGKRMTFQITKLKEKISELEKEIAELKKQPNHT